MQQLLLAPYFIADIQLLDSFDNVEFEHVPRKSKWEPMSMLK